MSYVSPAGRDKIAQWYEDLSTQERADADRFIDNVRKVRDWSWPDYTHLFSGIGELRWKSCNKQHRLLGFFSGEAWVVLHGCYHKGRTYTPHDSLETAKKRKGQIDRKEVATVEFDL